ncbi:Down syndrome cell adhesion molecule-like protein Dscam2 [Chionoecetes opilio]|uniref:Down syndrome cell adhesion molecule-like protein Dscam2 n=1 Tax=Chionoecetes opilio TaxID=41210 RepID=A0A8J4XVW3_CHIOP|nr:Down syndrome cell adhesion molecule-like protein Dscam2 [Chionoecetes opilio]
MLQVAEVKSSRSAPTPELSRLPFVLGTLGSSPGPSNRCSCADQSDASTQVAWQKYVLQNGWREDLPCDHCGKVCSSKAWPFTAHSQRHTNPQDELRCDALWQRCFHSKDALRSHMLNPQTDRQRESHNSCSCSRLPTATKIADPQQMDVDNSYNSDDDDVVIIEDTTIPNDDFLLGTENLRKFASISFLALQTVVVAVQGGAAARPPWGEVSREVENLDAHARYEMWVKASTRVGEGVSSRVVSQAPSTTVAARIKSFGQEVEVKAGAPLTLPCSVVGIPAPLVTWTHLGRDAIPKSQATSSATALREGSGWRRRWSPGRQVMSYRNSAVAPPTTSRSLLGTWWVAGRRREQ